MPDGFYWAPRCHLDTLPTGLFLHGEIVAQMLDRVDGTWLARLHMDDEITAPLITRRCSSFEAGRKGCEMWALRHQLLLQKNVALKKAWILENGVAARMLKRTGHPLDAQGL